MTYTIKFQNPDLLEAFRAMAKAAGEVIEITRDNAAITATSAAATTAAAAFETTAAAFETTAAAEEACEGCADGEYFITREELDEYYRSPEIQAAIAEARELKEAYKRGEIAAQSFEEFQKEMMDL